MRTTISLVLAGAAIFVAACTRPPAAAPPTTSAPPVSSVSAMPAAPSAPGTGTPATCGQTPAWGTGQKETPAYTTDALFEIRVGQHDCHDRVVFDIAGPAEVGYVVSYVPVVTADGSGKPVPVPGTAALQVVVRAPPQDFDASGAEPGFARFGDYFYTESQLAGWQSLRAIRFAGSFEGQCTIAIGVSATLPFQVSTQLDPTNNTRKLILDIAHPPA